jgi:hypothetical protein
MKLVGVQDDVRFSSLIPTLVRLCGAAAFASLILWTRELWRAGAGFKRFGRVIVTRVDVKPNKSVWTELHSSLN